MALLQSAAGFTIPNNNIPPTFTHQLRVKASSHRNVKLSDTSLHSSATEELAPGIQAIDAANGDLEPLLNILREQPYFRLYSVDMLGSCEYMPQELFECYSETCEIYPIDEDEVSICN